MSPVVRPSASPESSVGVKRRVVVDRVPVVRVERLKKRRKKRGGRSFSENILYPIGVFEHRILGGIARSASEYRHRSDESASKRRDGAVRDFMKNASRSSEEFFSQAVRAPGDILESKPLRRAWGEVRRMARIISW